LKNMKKSWALALAVGTLAIAGCTSTTANTAEAFVKKHAKAYYFRDAKAVAEMTLCAEDLGKTTVSQRIRDELKTFHRDSLRTALKDEMKDGDQWVAAWSDTRYASEKDQGDHITVEVKVGYAYSSIVLVRVGKYLKIAPNPSSFE
jgi:hypothetical protein